MELQRHRFLSTNVFILLLFLLPKKAIHSCLGPVCFLNHVATVMASEAGLPLASPCICFFPKPKERPCALQGHNRHVSFCLPHRVQMGVLRRLLGCPLRI